MILICPHDGHAMGKCEELRWRRNLGLLPRQLRTYRNFSRRRALVRMLYVMGSLQRKARVGPGEPEGHKA
jgi:hypothetical protein